MAGDCTHVNAWSDGEMESAGMSRGAANFEVIDGQLYRKKLERGFINYREVLDEERRHEALSTFHRRQPGQRHLSLEETYKCVAENYWWEGMYFQIRDFVLGCPECQSQHIKKTKELGGRRCVSKTITSHGGGVLSKLRSQREAGLFCDITLRTNSRSYLAHRAVLAAVSDHFQEIFTEMDMNMKADVDLTGFSEDTLVSLLDFSYSSTLCVRPEDLPEVIAMARHLGMWPAVEACTALMKEQERQLHPRKSFSSACAALCQERLRQPRDKDLELEDDLNSSFHLTLDASDESLEETPRRNLRRTPKSQGHNGLPMSPSHRMKLMDFKSPSSKKAATPQHTIAPPKSQSYSPVSPSSTRLLRSTPGAAKEVPRLFPMPVTPSRNKKAHTITRLSCPSRLRSSPVCSPVRVKQEVEEVGDDELDYARAQEKYKLMYVLGLQRTALLPRPEDLIGWRQKKRLRKLKANNYSLTKRRKPRTTSPGLPYADMTLSLPLCTPVNALLLNKSAKTKPAGRVSAEPVTAKKKKNARRKVPPSDRSMRSKGTLPDMFGPTFGGRELRRRKSDGSHPPARQPLRRNASKAQSLRTMVRIKEEPDEYCVSGLPPPANNNGGGFASYNPPPSLRTQPRSKDGVETVKALRYNSGRPAAKARLRRGSTREADKTKCVSKEEARKMGGPGLRGVLDPGPRVKFNQPDGLQFSEHAPPPPSIYGHPLYKAIKKEPADPIPVAPYPEPTSPDLGKRQSKPPIKLLDSGFLFSFCRPAAGAMAVLKKEEESVDICLTRSVSQVGDRFGVEQPTHRALRARGPPSHPVVKKEREERSVSQTRLQRPRPNPRNNTLHQTRSTKSKTPPSMPKHVQQQARLPLSSRSCVMLDAVRRARLKQLRGPRSQAPKVPKSAHACPQCSASYKDCDALIMHRLRHIEGKHWPCPLCCKTFFRLRNVRNHIRTHDPKLYKCRSCIAAGS